MDDLVRQAMAKWPNVPDCHGWLGLDARGQWFMRDDRAQAAGPFAGGTRESRGSQLRHDKLIEFIHRNYEADPQGRWYFQNGPQRVFVELEATPYIFRLGPDFTATAHTGVAAGEVRAVLLDEAGHLYLETALGFGLVHTLDMLHAAAAVERGVWQPEDVSREALPARFGFVRSPAAGRAIQSASGG